MKTINWYPGHINKSIREMELIVKKIDIVIVLLDARAPFSTYIDLFQTINNKKKFLIVITKIDLAPEEATKKALEHFKNLHPSIALNLKENTSKGLQKILKELSKIKIKSLIPKVMIVGVPNVGKSTLINFLSKKSKAIAQDRAGVTKKMSWFQIDKYYIMDTPGILLPKFEDKNINYRLAIIGSIKQSILPYDEVGLYLLDFLKSCSILKFDLSEEYADIKAKEQHLSLDEYYRKLLYDLQKGRFGKVYLDDFSWKFEDD